MTCCFSSFQDAIRTVSKVQTSALKRANPDLAARRDGGVLVDDWRADRRHQDARRQPPA
jgi:hypothetical protein